MRAVLTPFADSLVHSTAGVRIAFMEYWFVNQAPVFMIGVCIYHLIQRRRVSVIAANLLIGLGLVAPRYCPSSIPGPYPVPYGIVGRW